MGSCTASYLLQAKLDALLTTEFTAKYDLCKPNLPAYSAISFGSAYGIIGSFGLAGFSGQPLTLSLDNSNVFTSFSKGCGSYDYIYAQIPVSGTTSYQSEIRINGIGHKWPLSNPQVTLSTEILGSLLLIVPFSKNEVEFSKLRVDIQVGASFTSIDTTSDTSPNRVLSKSIPLQKGLDHYCENLNDYLKTTLCPSLIHALQSKDERHDCSIDNSLVQDWPQDYTNNFANEPCLPCDANCLCNLQSRCDGTCSQSPAVSCSLSNSWTNSQLVSTILLLFLSLCIIQNY